MRRSITFVAGVVGVLAGVGSSVNSSPPVPPDDQIVASFTAWAESQGTPVSRVACSIDVAGIPYSAICYGMADGPTAVGAYAVLGPDAAAMEWDGFEGTAAAPTATTTPGATTTAAGLATSFGDGRFEVGTEIAPGLYQATVSVEDPLCLVTVYVTPTETDILAGTSVSTTGTHYFEVPADAHSIEFESIDDACIWMRSP
jgi:hypothetical protein